MRLFFNYMFVFIVTALFMALYEFIKEKIASPDLTRWESHIITILVTATISTITAGLISTKFRKKEEELNILNEKLHNLSTTDELTNLNNRREFNRQITHHWERWRRDGIIFSLMLIDVDYFKSFNDIYGHISGDKCLANIANTLSGCFKRYNDVVARYGGEEFAVILPGVDKEQAIIFAQNACSKIENSKIPHKSSVTSEFVTISIGLSVCNEIFNAENCNSVILSADKALYLAKDNGRNRYEFIK